jgi:DNA-binding response OmpR family regulator
MAKILIVEDEKDLAHSVRDWLLLEGHRVDAVQDGNQALEWLRSNEYDVIVLDVLLPGLDGFEVCRRYRRSGGLGRVLMLTAKSGINDKESGLDAGADDYITKPFDLKEVSARVRALMRRSISVVGAQLIAADLIVDLTVRKVSRGDNEIKLLPQEFALLEFMIRQPNRIFSADTLIKRVWNGNSSVDTVRTHIKTLRKKVDLPGLQPLIKTVHGVGYSLGVG